MYNAELKSRFISDFATSVSKRSVALALFNATEPYESKWDSDICTFRGDHLSFVVGEIVGFRVSSMRPRISVLKSYAKWCIENHVPGACSDMLYIEDVGDEKLKRQTVASPGHLQMYLNSICDKESDETTDSIYRCYYWLAYGGMEESDALAVTTDEVDFDRMIVTHCGEEYPIYRESLHAFRNCVRLESFRHMRANMPADHIIYRDRAAGNLLLRSTSVPSAKTFRVEMSRRSKNLKRSLDTNKNLSLNLSFYRVWLSGIFYRVYELERCGVPADFTDTAERFISGKTYKFSARQTMNTKRISIAEDYMQDYLRWKEVYSI